MTLAFIEGTEMDFKPKFSSVSTISEICGREVPLSITTDDGDEITVPAQANVPVVHVVESGNVYVTEITGKGRSRQIKVTKVSTDEIPDGAQLGFDFLAAPEPLTHAKAV
jgi:hypothetical protein